MLREDSLNSVHQTMDEIVSSCLPSTLHWPELKSHLTICQLGVFSSLLGLVGRSTDIIRGTEPATSQEEIVGRLQIRTYCLTRLSRPPENPTIGDEPKHMLRTAAGCDRLRWLA
jgi:hypothetical protein